MKALFAIAGLGMCLGACGSSEPSGPPPELRDDARALEELLADDLVLLAVAEADEAVADDLPVRGAERLRAGAIPAARRQVEQARAVSAATAEGVALRDEVVAALDARRAALERYADVLERGLVEDLELAVALRAQREAEGGIDTLLGRLQAIRQPENTSPR
ncbi:MAG: hypothetical protein H6721_22095 [Sandaracinus sp.]|nr:hypothetical protein [Myxococcales bacterium]MCB9599655.1 hypothetical protein [Sandaracinus sp.]MCB9618384.1 hypothetical protein [Sandaracinus sp.]MCB9623071.1 hypothetical protein [Sandaracinus sp.]MCB9634827.1 hypothetical protein [Sandaracinus sp.]